MELGTLSGRMYNYTPQRGGLMSQPGPHSETCIDEVYLKNSWVWAAVPRTFAGAYAGVVTWAIRNLSTELTEVRLTK